MRYVGATNYESAEKNIVLNLNVTPEPDWSYSASRAEVLSAFVSIPAGVH